MSLYREAKSAVPFVTRGGNLLPHTTLTPTTATTSLSLNVRLSADNLDEVRSAYQMLRAFLQA